MHWFCGVLFCFEIDLVAFAVTTRNKQTVSPDADKHEAKACRKWVCLPSVSHWLLNQTERDRQGQRPPATGLLFLCNEGDCEERGNCPAANPVKSARQSHKNPQKNSRELNVTACLRLWLVGGGCTHTSCFRTLSSLAVEADTGKVQ